VARQVVGQARGNPFVIHMLCAHYVTTNDETSLEHTLTELLARRLDRLTPSARRTLEAAVILAKNCTLDRLRRLLELPRRRLLATIEQLDEQGLIDVADGYIVRSHALLAEAVSERMAPSVLRLLHGASAELLYKEVDPAASGALLWDCAEHWRRAGNEERAIAVLMECADRSVESGRATDAVRTLHRALTLDARDEKRLAIVEKALLIAWTTHVHVEGRFFMSELTRLRAALGLPVHVHDHFELLEMAITKQDGTSSDYRRAIQQLRRCISAVNASPKHRLGAAHQLLVWAEMILDPDASRFAYAVREEMKNISETDFAVAKRLAFEMIYEGGFGDPRRARVAAREVAAWARLGSIERYPLLINAAIAQYRIALPNEAEETLRLAWDRARQYEFVFAEANVALTLARLFWSTERLEECIVQHRLVTELVAHSLDAEICVDHSILGARLATLQGRYSEAASYIARARAFPHAQLAHPDLLLRCCELDIRLATESAGVGDVELEQLLALHLRARGLGLQDEVMATVVRCLDRADRSSEAQHLLREYLSTHRRDGFPVPSWLIGLKASHSDRPVALAGHER
jgi:tetratricopeptide (TPR) repeat protein